MKKRLLNLFVLLVLTSTMVLSPHTTRPTQAAQVGVTVEPELQAQLSADETTGYMIYFRDKADLGAASQMNWSDRGRFVMQALQATAQPAQARVQAYLNRQGVAYRPFWIDNVIVVDRSNQATVDGLLAFAEIESLRANRVMGLIEPAKVEPAAQPMGIEPNIAHVNADDVWALGITGQGAVVGSIDTGVRYTHEALVNQYRGNLGRGNFDHNYNWWDPYGEHPAEPGDDNGHGTHTMGTMIGDDGGANQIGMAPGAQWISCRGCSSSGCSGDALLACAQFMAAPTDLGGGNPNPDLRPYAVNNSWGDCSTWYDPWFQGAVDSWQAAGIYPLFANGNASNCGYEEPPACGTVANPARYGNVTGVGSTGQQDGAYAAHSNRGPSDVPDPVNPNGYETIKPQVAAPGVGIRSSVNGSDSAYEGGWSGTSMSTPHVTGLVALMWSAAPCLVGDYAATEDILQSTAVPITAGLPGSCDGEGPGQYPNQSTGWGEIDALAAVEGAIAACGDSTLAGHVSEALKAPGDPIAGATIVAESATEVRTTHADAHGDYAMYLFAGAYTVTVSAYGYDDQTTTGVILTTGNTTTLDVALPLAEFYDVYGVITDTTTGWPLYAQVTIDGYPGDPIWTDPATGVYSIALAEGIEYTLYVEAWSPGYLPGSLDIGPLAGDEEHDFDLDADMTGCAAPGYGMTVFYEEDFEADNGSYSADGANSSWAWGQPTSGPGNAHSGINVWATGLTGTYNVDEDSYLTSPDIDLSAAGGSIVLTWWQWLQTEGFFDPADVQVSSDGGITWTTIYGPVSGPVDMGWTQHRVILDSSYAVSNMRLRFHLFSDSSMTYPGWYIDDITMAGNCHTQPGGLVVGNVHDDNTGAGLNGAVVAVDTGGQAVAKATPDDPNVDDGFYTVFAQEVVTTSHLLTATMALYIPAVANLVVPNGSTVQQDLALRAGMLSFTPAGISATLELGGATSLLGTIANEGSEPAAFTLTEMDYGFDPLKVSIPAYTGSFVHSPASIGRAPQAGGSTSSTEEENAPALLGTRAYAVDLVNGLLGYFDSSTPDSWTIVGSVGTTQYFSGDFLGGDFSHLYVIDYNDNNLYTLDTTTAATTLVGPAIPVSGEDWTGMTGSPDGTVYAVSTSCANSTLYTIDPRTGTPAVIGSISAAPCLIDIAINATGQMYGVDIMSDELVQIDPETGAGTVVGSIGFDTSYAQGMDFEETTGVLYLAAYNVDKDRGELRIASLATGNTVLVGVFPNGTEVDCLAFASGGTSNVPWLAETPTAGTLLPSAGEPITVTLDASVPEVTQPGTYHASINIDGDTPYARIKVPVTMTVTPPDSYGKLLGIVTGLGYCDADPGVLVEASITVESSLGRIQTAQTDRSGYYQLWLDSAENPFTVTAAYAEHETQTVTSVVIVGQNETELNPDLRWLRPCLETRASTFESELVWGEQATRPLTLTNHGAAPLNYQFFEAYPTYEPTPRASGHGEWLYQATEGVPMESNGGEKALAYPKAYRWTPDQPSANLNILLYADDYFHAPPNTYPDQALQALGLPYTAYYNADWDAFQAALTGGSWDMVLFANESYNESDELLAALNDYVLGGGKLVFSAWLIGNRPELPLWSTLGFTYVTFISRPMSPVYWWEPAHPIFTTPDGVPEFTSPSDGYIWCNGHKVDPLPGFAALAGYTTPGPDPSEAAMVLGNQGRTIFKGFLDGSNDADLDGDGVQDGVELWVNIIDGLQTGFAVDLPWLAEEPVTGTVAPNGGQVVIDVTMNSTGAAQPGRYTANLLLKGDDPWATPVWPVTMTVLPSAGMGHLRGYVTDRCDDEPVAATIDFIGGTPIAQTVADDAGWYDVWMISGTYPIVFSGEDYDPYTATAAVVAGQVTTVSAALLPLRPCLALEPGAFEVWVVTGTAVYTATPPLSLANEGGVPLDFQLFEIESGYISTVNRLALPPAAAPFTASGTLAYGINYYTAELGTFDIGEPGTWTPIGSIGYAGYLGGDFLGGDFSRLYALEINESNLYTLDIVSATATLIGPAIPASGEYWTDLAGALDGALYAASTNCAIRSTLYTINPATGEATMIGEVPNAACLGGLAISAEGVLYGVDFASDMLLEINPGTGESTVIGPIGLDADWGMGLDLDEDSGVLYMTAFSWATGGELRTVDLATGNTTLVGALAGGAMIDCLAFASGGVALDVPWVQEEPASGTVPALDTGMVDLVFTALYTDGTPMPLGTYTATLLLKTSDLSARYVPVPVVMHVVEPEVYGVYLPLVVKGYAGK